MLTVRVATCVACVVVASVVHARVVDGLYSSFYAPLYEPRTLGYRVEARFPPEGGRAAREPYRRLYGYRGESLVAALGRGEGPSTRGDAGGGGGHDNNMYGDVNIYYTYT